MADDLTGLDPYKVESYKVGTEWLLVPQGDGMEATLKVTEDGAYPVRVQWQDAEDWGVMPVFKMEEYLRGDQLFNLHLQKGGLKEPVPEVDADEILDLLGVAPGPETFCTRAWFYAFIERALDLAEEKDWCAEVEDFLDREGISGYRSRFVKTEVITATVTVKVEVTTKGRKVHNPEALRRQVMHDLPELLTREELTLVDDLGNDLEPVELLAENITVTAESYTDKD